VARVVSTHAPLAGSDDHVVSVDWQLQVVSTHAPLAGSDPMPTTRLGQAGCFNPRSPCGERPR